MTRSSRSGLRLAATTLLPLLVFSVADRAVISAQTKSPSVARPNIVLFVADDLGVTDIGPYGAKRVRTPNLDRLAAQSMRFDRAYAGSPTCVPSRATLYVGQTLASLEKNGLAENTIFIFTSDQGPQWPFAKWTVYDAGIRVPLLVRWPNVVKAGGATDAMVSLADVVPTFVEAAGGKPPEGLDGQSFLKVLQGQTGVHRERIFATHTGDGEWNRNPARCIRSGRYKLILNLAPEITHTTHMDLAKDHDGGREYWPSWEERAKTARRAAAVIDRYRNHPKEEFYDLLTDPNEIHNLIGDQKYADIVADLRARLAEWRKQQGDDKTGPDSAASVK
jgi:N-sulfoglucosamine sulfohydrolase